MGLKMREKKAVIREVAPRYQRSSKKEKGRILNEFITLTGYNRCYARYVLRSHGKKTRLSSRTVIQGDITKSFKLKRGKIYDSRVFEKLRSIWIIMDCICGKRLAPVLPEIIQKLVRHKEIKLDRETRKKLMKISPATIDRLLASERKKQALKGKKGTKPGTLLKKQIPVRTFAQWDEQRPGFVEIDLVGHEGGEGSGEFAQTLDVTDINTTWTETEAVRNKAQIWVFKALENIKERLPFDLLGIDSDNGAEFINGNLLDYCKEHKITFTRSRKYRKNDNCFVEQKNYSIVRRAVGYMRYDTEEELDTLNELYKHLRLYTNYFQPTMKLLEKIRMGSSIKKKYDIPKTPFRRVLQSPHIPQEKKDRLQIEFDQLNPAELKRQITRLQDRLLVAADAKKKPNTRTKAKKPINLEYIFM